MKVERHGRTAVRVGLTAAEVEALRQWASKQEPKKLPPALRDLLNKLEGFTPDLREPIDF